MNMSIFNEEYCNYLTETKSEAKQDLRNRTADRVIRSKSLNGEIVGHSVDSKKTFTNGNGTDESYRKHEEELKAVSKPMRTAADYKRREKFYSDSNKYQSQEENDNDKRRKFTKRPILGAAQRKLNRLEDEKYRGTERGRLTGSSLYNNDNCLSSIKRKNLKEACEYILSVLEESEYDDYDLYDNEY